MQFLQNSRRIIARLLKPIIIPEANPRSVSFLPMAESCVSFSLCIKRSETYNQHTLSTAFSCAKGFLLESKPGEAAAVIQLICQTYGDDKKSAVSTEFKKLVNEWPVEALADSLKSVIPSMVNALLSSGLNVSVDLDELYKKDDLLS